MNEKKRKPRPKPGPYPAHKPKDKNAAATSAIIKPKHETHRLYPKDWVDILDFVDRNPEMRQHQIIEHFRNKNRPEGALIFNQGTLSKHCSIKGRKALAAKLASNQNTRRIRVITSPVIDKALWLWYLHMEEKGESINGPMLGAKRQKLEEQLNIPREERLTSSGWIQSFCKAYGLKDFRRHGEAGSVDVAAVAEERARLSEILSTYAKKDQWNFDETGLYAFAPPDRGLARSQMSGKKASKFRITIGFACNADGSETLPPFFIGKSKHPRCFGPKTAKHPFYYRNNSTSWMTAFLFNEWIKVQDQTFRRQERRIILLIDNFSGHVIDYQPSNIRLEFLAPNMTSFIQPLDAGIIRCFKAHYRRSFCLRAIEQDDAGIDDIYKINLLEAIHMAISAWKSITPETRRNCWNHTKIQSQTALPDVSMNDHIVATKPASKSGLHNVNAWMIILSYACGDDSDASLPMIITKLEKELGDSYRWDDWKPAFDAIFAAEKDDAVALMAVEELAKPFIRQNIERKELSNALESTTCQRAVSSELEKLEDSLMSAVADLHSRKRIRGAPLTLEDLLNPIEERTIGEAQFAFPGGDSEIIAEAQKLLGHRNNDDDENDDDSDEDELTGQTMSNVEGIQLCEQMANLCITHSDAAGISLLDIQRQLRLLRGHLHRLDQESRKQTTLDRFLPQPSPKA